MKRESLLRILDLIEEYGDRITYGKDYRPFDKVVSSDKAALVNYDKEEGEYIIQLRKLRRRLVGEGIASWNKVTKRVEKGLSKALSIEEYQGWLNDFGKRVPKALRDFENKLLIPVSLSFGKGHAKARQDLGIKDSSPGWMYRPGHTVPRLTNLRLLNYISDSLTIDMKTAIVEGMRAGEDGITIGRRLRQVLDKGKVVTVAPKVDPKTGNTVRQGYSYTIPAKRYTEMIGRTEVNRATIMGRVDGYRQSGTVKSVRLITAGDTRVCQQCAGLDGYVYELDEAGEAVPVHVMCRCTVMVHEYHDLEDPQARWNEGKPDTTDMAVATAPITYLQGVQLREAADHFKKHLEARSLGTKVGMKKVYNKLVSQLEEVGVTSVTGFKEDNIQHLYAMYEARNERLLLRKLYFQRKGFPKLTKVSLAYRASLGKGNLAGCTYTKSGIPRVTLSGLLVNSKEITVVEMRRVIAHELGHSISGSPIEGVSPEIGSAAVKSWIKIHERSKATEFVSLYATTDAIEDFAESFAAYVHNADLLRKVAPIKYQFMKDTIF